MARFIRRVTALSSLVLFVGCGGATPPAQTPGDATQGGAKPAPGEIAGSADLSPVDAPKDLFLVGRFKDPGAAVDTISNWAGMPMDWRKMLAHHQPGFARIVAVDAPVDVAASLDVGGGGDLPQPFAVVSVGLNSLDEAVAFARKHGEDVHKISTGVYRVGGDDVSCAVAASVGSAPARLVCGDRREDVDALLPYMTRGLPTANLATTDLHLELRAEPFRRHYAGKLREMKTLAVPFVLKELSLDSPSFDRALADAVHGLGDEFLALIEDIDTVGVDATIDKQKQVIHTTGDVKFRGGASWTVHTLLDSATRAGPPPDLFWKLPKDVASAGYSVSADTKRYKDIARTTQELVDGLMSHERMPRRVRDQTVDAIEQLFKLEGARVYARGSVPLSGSKGLANRKRNRVVSMVGWNIIGMDTKAAQPKKLLSTLARVYNNAQLKKLLDKQLGKNAKKALPKLKVHGARAPGLAPGSTAYELQVPASLFEGHHWVPKGQKKTTTKAPAVKALTLTIVLMPDGDQTWLGISTDTKALYGRLAQIHKGKNTLAAREGLARLKGSKAISGGFVTLESFTGSLRSDLGSEFGSGFKKSLDKVFEALPNHGETPIPYTFTVAQDGGVRLNWVMDVPKPVVADLGAMVPALIALRSQMGGAMMPMP